MMDAKRSPFCENIRAQVPQFLYEPISQQHQMRRMIMQLKAFILGGTGAPKLFGYTTGRGTWQLSWTGHHAI